MAITTPIAGTVTVALEKIHVPDNVRELDSAHVDALAGSIALQGLLQPVLLVPAVGEVAGQGFEFELTAGFHRYAAVSKLAHAAIDAVIRERDSEADGADIAAARATENVARKQLNAYEEAVAVRAMLQRGLTQDGAAQALGWPKARVVARVKLLELPENAQRMVGDGRIGLAAVDQLRAIGQVAPGLQQAVIAFAAENEWAAGRLSREPGWVIDSALRQTDSKVFAEHLSEVGAYEIAALKLGKRAEAQYGQLGELAKTLDRQAYGSPRVPFSEEDVDQARAAGVLIEFESSRPVIVDRAVYRELVKQAIRRHLEELTVRVEQQEADRKAAKQANRADADPAGEAKREHGRRMRTLAAQAHNANTDLGWALRNGLAVVDPSDITVARFMVYALLEGDGDGSYGTSGERARDLAARGVRLVVEEFRTDVTKTRKDGSRGALRIDYGTPQDSTATREWLWKYIDGAKSAGELYGRALVVIAAERYALRMVLPASQQHAPIRWPSRKDQAEKALARLAGPFLPASLKQLEKAIAKAKADYERQLAAIRTAPVSDTEHAVDDNDDNEDGEVNGLAEADGEGEGDE
jgi:ParB/RepB/Spo0J family partition protein